MALIKRGEAGLSSHRYGILLAMLVMYLVINPFFVNGESKAVIAFNVSVLLVLIANVYAATHRLRPLLTASSLAVLGYAAFIAADLTKLVGFEFFGFVFIGLLWVYSAVSILLHILTRPVVTTDTLAGAVAVYLQIGLIWAILFIVIETFIPGSFNFSGVPLTAELAPRADFYKFLYYSFVTLTTLGYGDYLAVSPPAQSLSFLETALGQVYLAVLVARLLGLHLTTMRPLEKDKQ
jgi:voltage-gated potassium channel